jgi:hypothetical protein
MDPTGTRRRAHALIALGWPQQHLATHLGMTLSNFSTMLSRPNVLVRRALAVRAMYNTLWNADPAEQGASLAGITRARRRAAANGWAPVGAWDDDTIDDPAAHPDWTGHCGTWEGYVAHQTYKIPYCQPCREAAATHRREQRAQAGQAAA